MVQLKRDAAGLCTVKCKMCPEHKVRAKDYSVTMVINEKEEIVESLQCHDCAASLGTCKHAIAFLMWTHRRSEEPSCTSVQCYWKKSRLSKVATTLKCLSAKDLARENHRVVTTTSTTAQTGVLSEFLLESRKRKLNCEILNHDPNYHEENMKILSLHMLMVKCSDLCADADAFIRYVSELPDLDAVTKKIESETRGQHNNSLWHELRYARITASKALAVSRCKTEDGRLVAATMGAKLPDNPQMKRGRLLEDAVRDAVEVILGKKIKQCVIFISTKCPIVI